MWPGEMTRAVVTGFAISVLLLMTSCVQGGPGPVPTAVQKQEVPCLALEPRFTANLELTAAEIETLRQSCERISELRQRDVAIRLVDGGGKPLKDTAVHIQQTRHAFLFGGQPNELARGVISAAERARYEELLFALFNHVWLGGGFQWTAYEPNRGGPRPDTAERLLQWAAQHGARVRAGDLVYQLFYPGWFKEISDPDERLRVAVDHTREMVTRFRGRVAMWNVVNETQIRPPLTEQNDRLTPNVPIESVYKRVADYVDPLFREARRSDPEAVLLINEAALLRRKWLDRFEVILRELKQRNTPFDAVGVQAHMKADGRVPLDQVQEHLTRLSRYGRLYLTETSVPSRPWLADERPFDGVPWPGWSEQTQAGYTVALFTVGFGHPAVDGMTYWTFTERTTDTVVTGTALLSETLVPRPAYDALRRLLRETWWTRWEGNTDRAGVVHLRAFYGDYELALTLPDGRIVTLPFQVGAEEMAITLAVESGK